MKGSISIPGRSGESFQTNTFVAFLEIVVVLFPFYLGLAISDGLGSDQTSLVGDVVIIGGPIAYLGLIISLLYADFPAAIHFATWPESILSVLLFGWLFHKWERNPKDRRIAIPLIVLVVMALVLGMLGVLFGGG